MNLARTLYIIFTYPNRLRHRLGFGVQSPWAYELVRDVLFEKLYYYAYDDLNLDTEADRQLWRIKHRFGPGVEVIDGNARFEYEKIADEADSDTVIVVEHIDSMNADLWRRILEDDRNTVTFDLIYRGLVTFNKKLIKQNYTL